MRAIDVRHKGQEKVICCWEVDGVLIDPGPGITESTLLDAIIHACRMRLRPYRPEGENRRRGWAKSIRALAASTGRSYGFVHRVLTESGVQLRQRGGARRRKKA